jgi:hypothetical protein
LVVGGQGVLGSAVAGGLSSSGWRVTRAGRHPEAASDFALVDLDRPETLVEASAGADLVVNCVRHPALAPQRTVLRQGGTMLDVSDLPLDDRRLLKAQAGGSRGLVVVHAGLGPGVSTLVLADMLAAHPDADTLELVVSLSATQSSGTNSFDFFWPFLTAAGGRGSAVVRLPPPYGRRRCMALSGGEEGWIGELGDGRTARVYVCLLQRSLNAGLVAASRLRLLRLLPRPPRLSAETVARASLTREPKVDWAAVGRGGRRLAARSVEGEGGYRLTAAAAVAFAEALAERRASDGGLTGVHGAEELFTLAELRPGLEARGVAIRDRDPG